MGIWLHWVHDSSVVFPTWVKFGQISSSRCALRWAEQQRNGDAQAGAVAVPLRVEAARGGACTACSAAAPPLSREPSGSGPTAGGCG